VRLVVLLICLTACRFGFEARTAGDGGGDSPDDGGGPDVAFGDCWSAWLTGPLQLSTPAPVTSLNTGVLEGDPFLSPDALTMYFARSGDLFAATRPDRFSAFGDVTAITELNSAQDETKLTVTSDGRVAIWSTTRTGSLSYDLWEATRATSTGAFATPTQTSFAQINTTDPQYDPHISGDGLRLYHSPATASGQSISIATRTTVLAGFEAPTAVDDLGANRTGDPALSPDERVIVYSAKQSPNDTLTIWYASRSVPAASFSNAQRIASLNDGTIHDQDPVLSFDGCELYFSRHLGTEIDLFVSMVQ
jgi:hypothetical protein